MLWVYLTMITGLLTLGLSFFPYRRKALLRLRKISLSGAETDTSKSGIITTFRRIYSDLSSKIGRMLPAALKDRVGVIKQKFPQIDIDVERLSGLIVLCALIPGSAVLIIFRLSPEAVVLSIPASLIGGSIPIISLKRKSEQQKEKILRALPHMSDILLSFILGGQNIDHAFRSAAELSPEPLRSVLVKASMEIEMGVARRTAFERVEKKYNIHELSLLLRFLTSSEERGYPLSHALAVISREIRAIRRDELKAQVAKAPLKMLAPLIFLILPASVILTVGPTVLLMFNRGL